VRTKADIQRIRNDERAAENLRTAAERMWLFYNSTSHWLSSFDHNHLRITRIIKSLRLLLGDKDADAVRERILDRVQTIIYWKEA
jgi:hypothetical protein